MANNRIDPVHAVTSMALALVEIQKDIASLQRQHVELSSMVVKIDSVLVSKFSSVDKAVMYCLGKLKEEETDAANEQRQKDNEGHGEDLSEQREGSAGVLRDDSGEEAKGGGSEEAPSVKEEPENLI